MTQETRKAIESVIGCLEILPDEKGTISIFNTDCFHDLTPMAEHLRQSIIMTLRDTMCDDR
jgi:hypothetical protein